VDYGDESCTVSKAGIACESPCRLNTVLGVIFRAGDDTYGTRPGLAGDT